MNTDRKVIREELNEVRFDCNHYRTTVIAGRVRWGCYEFSANEARNLAACLNAGAEELERTIKPAEPELPPGDWYTDESSVGMWRIDPAGVPTYISFDGTVKPSEYSAIVLAGDHHNFQRLPVASALRRYRQLTKVNR